MSRATSPANTCRSGMHREGRPAPAQRRARPAGSPPPEPPSVSWSSPLVVDGRVYVGFGERESEAFGFVCLDAATGQVVWLFCTDHFVAGQDNSPNVSPESAAGGPLPAGFST